MQPGRPVRGGRVVKWIEGARKDGVRKDRRSKESGEDRIGPERQRVGKMEGTIEETE